MDNKDILMILPKRTISHPSDLSRHWESDYDGSGVTIFSDDSLLGHAMWKESEDFGTLRPAIHVLLARDAEQMKLFEAMVSRLALAYEMMPSRWPLYIRLPKESLDLIAKASRMGFVPYIGEWQERNSEQSQEDWQEVTEQLRQAYPQGLQA